VSSRFHPRKKFTLGQSELLIALVFIGLFSGVVIAQNATNLTNITGNFLPNFSNETFENASEIIPEPSQITIETIETIEVWANSMIELNLDKNVFYDNETLQATASVFLDNGSLIEDATIDFYLDYILIGSNSTGSSGSVAFNYPLENLSGEYVLSAVFEGADYINPSEEYIEIEVLLSDILENDTYDWISYDPITDTITLVGNDEYCNAFNPCTLTDIYNADQANGWNRVFNTHSYFVFNSGLIIGNGINETFLTSEFEHVLIQKPWVVSSGGHLSFGSLEYETIHSGTFIETNVPEEYELEKQSAIKVRSGGELRLFGSMYKVFHPTARNNIYAEEGSKIQIRRVTFENIHNYEYEPIVYAPSYENREIEDYLSARKECYTSSGERCIELQEEGKT